MADTSAFVALLRQKDHCHAAASHFMASQPSLVTTDYIMDETVTLLMTRVSKASALHFLKSVRQSRLIRLESVGDAGFAHGARLFEEYNDKRWSFTDSTSFAVMQRLGIRQAFTFDHHFEQMGFQCVPEVR